MDTPKSSYVHDAPISGLEQKTAVVHDWCPSFRGGERVIAAICSLYKNADIFTLFDFLPPDIKEEFFPGVDFHTSIANRIPWIQKFYRSLFFACPFLIEQFDVTEYDTVISSSAAFSRGVITRPDQPHFCYVHSPIRYAWDEQFSYLAQGRLGYGPKGFLFRYMLHNLRVWDTRTAHGPDLMAANSTYVRARIRRIYGRDAEIIFPPVSFEGLDLITDKDDYYVTASFLAPYKRTDLVIQAFNDMPARKLLVVGDGQQSKALRSLAKSNVTFTGFLDRPEYSGIVGKAKALVFAGCEDFGIALAEAQVCGTPLIAYGRGGASDIVEPLGESNHPTGILFERQSVAAVRDAIEHFETNRHAISAADCHQNAKQFSVERFEREIVNAVGRTIDMHAKG